MMKNILITGYKGQLGSEIKELSIAYSHLNFHFTDVEELDISNKDAIENYVVNNNIDVIVNCAAYTAVDKAETDIELADKLNHKAVQYLSEAAKKQGSSLIHISTDYVFDGKNFKPYATDQNTNPVNMYGETKLKGEKVMKDIDPKGSLIIRTSWVYSSFGNNFVKTMLRLGEERDTLNVIYDQVGVPTYARDLAKFIIENCLDLDHDSVQTYHYTNEGVCSWYDFAREIMDVSKTTCNVYPIPTEAYPTPAKRPFYSLMDKNSLKENFKVEIPYWKDSLQDCIKLIQDRTVSSNTVKN